jgi:hypothetical protein
MAANGAAAKAAPIFILASPSFTLTYKFPQWLQLCKFHGRFHGQLVNLRPEEEVW